MADINIQEVTNHINIETANGYNLKFNGPVVNMNVVLSNYYTKTETDALLNEKADKADTYTKSETNILLNDKADKADTYTISQIDGMVQDINTAIDTKQNLITGAASTITDSNLTTNRAVISNASGKVAVSNVTSAELGYLSGVTSAVQTQLNNKASTSLDNLSADGQMIIDSQNGTISNCILEIPQNIKLELSNGTVTLKAGSIITRTGSTYSTVTTTQDVTWSTSTQANVKQYLFITAYGFAVGLYGRCNINNVGSGDTLPANGSTYLTFYNTTDKVIYQRNSDTSQWESTTTCYPLGIIEIDENGNITGFAKDSNGNDIIFNGAGFIGHHAFVYPNVKGLDANGKTLSGNLASVSIKTNSLQIIEMPTNAMGGICLSNIGVVNLSDTNAYYDEKNNLYYRNSSDTSSYLPVSEFTTNSNNIVTNFTIRQPVRIATVEMLNNTLGDIETLLAAI